MDIITKRFKSSEPVTIVHKSVVNKDHYVDPTLCVASNRQRVYIRQRDELHGRKPVFATSYHWKDVTCMRCLAKAPIHILSRVNAQLLPSPTRAEWNFAKGF